MNPLTSRIRKAIRLSFHPIYRHELRHGIGAAIEHTAALRRLRLRSVLDVGANKGQFSLVVKHLFPQSEVHAFEPLHEPARRFSNLFAEDPNVYLHEVALGPNDAQASIHISGREDSSSLLSILPRQETLYPGTAEVSTRQVKVKRGDDVVDAQCLEQPLLIKLDIQGYEKEALAGMPLLLARATYIYSEVSFQELYENQILVAELIAFLQERGFRLDAIYNLSTDDQGHPIYADALFTRANL